MNDITKIELTELDKNLLEEWYRVNHYSQGDWYYTLIRKGKIIVGHGNDYPLQHGKGGEVVVSMEQFNKIKNA